MQTSVRADSLQRTGIRSLSGESVHVSREVSVVSTQAPTPTNIPANINENVPAEFAPGVNQRPQPIRWNSRTSDKSWRNSRTVSLHAPRISFDGNILHSNRESMKALSDFLMTREPPPSNFMSIPSDDEKDVSSLKKTALKLLGKQSKLAKPPRLMQLPDSAVAAHTRSGARHIAISIPIEYDHLTTSTSNQPPNPLRSHPLPKADRGGVTVLNSVAEVLESASLSFRSERRSRDGTTSSGNRPHSSAARSQGEKKSIDTTRMMSAYHPDSMSTTRQSRVEPSPANYNKRPQRSYVAVSPMYHQDSQGVDLRHSGGTIYSQMSLGSTAVGHSRNISSVSTAPSSTLINSLKPDLPPRTSSISKMPKALQEELAIASMLASANVAEESSASPTKSAASNGTSPSPPTVYSIAVRGYNASPVGRPHVVTQKSHTSNLTATTLSPREAQEEVVSRPSTAPALDKKHLTVPQSEDTIRRNVSNRDRPKEPIVVTRQSRQERVRAKKLRDLASVRPHTSPTRPLCEATGTGDSQTPVSISATPRNPKREANSGGGQQVKATVNTLSPIMLVANLQPYTGYVTKSDLPLQRSSRHAKSKAATSPESTTGSSHTPPRSVTTSLSSDNDLDSENANSNTNSTSTVSKNKIKPRRRSPAQSFRSSVLETRRQERRAKRNMTLREKEMDARMSKIERDNMILLQTLGKIAKSFGEISRIGQETRLDRKTMARLLDEECRSSEVGTTMKGELEIMEPMMREMQVMAPSVSMEVHKVRKEGQHEGEDDSDDGRSILE